MESIQSQVMGIIASALLLERTQLSITDSFEDDLGADYLDLLDIVITIEDRFIIDITNDQLLKMQTVNDCINCVEYVLMDCE